MSDVIVHKEDLVLSVLLLLVIVRGGCCLQRSVHEKIPMKQPAMMAMTTGAKMMRRMNMQIPMHVSTATCVRFIGVIFNL